MTFITCSRLLCYVCWLLSLATHHGIHSSESEEPDSTSSARTLDEIEALIHTYSLTDPSSRSRDGEQQSIQDIETEFLACLKKLSELDSTVFSDILMNKVIVGVYRRRCHAIKHMLAEGHQLVQWSQVGSLPGWGKSIDLLRVLLAFRNSLRKNGGEVAQAGGSASSGPQRDEECGRSVAGDETGGSASSGPERDEECGRSVAGGSASSGPQRDEECGRSEAGDEAEGNASSGPQRDHHSDGGSLRPVDLSVKLGMVDVLEVLLEAGVELCPSLECTGSLHYATINQDTATLQLLLHHIKSELAAAATGDEATTTGKESTTTGSDATTAETSQKQHLCALLTRSKLSFGWSPLDIGHLQCSSGLSCNTLMLLLQWTHSSCGWDYSLQGYRHDHMTCPVAPLNHSRGVSLKERWRGCVLEGRGCGFNVLSGHWRVYGEHLKGGSEGCGLVRIDAGRITHAQFERDYVDIGIPVVITGLTRKWPLLQTWKRDNLVKHFPNMDMLVGPIPYGEVFGERFGYATVREFLAYMDGYASADASMEIADLTDFKAPLYVFDGELMKTHFSGQYDLNGLNVSSWRNHPQYLQFILGPAGSGAPFHFHCHAINALLYGRKRWFLYAPGHAHYSKQHPLLWYHTTATASHPINRQVVECVQRAGDVLYVPGRWTHATLNLDESIGMAVEFDTGDC